ncbi:MAG: hypothetical protein AB1695_14555 [Stygiobacter sp.]|jgi:chromosome segregation ATPase
MMEKIIIALVYWLINFLGDRIDLTKNEVYTLVKQKDDLDNLKRELNDTLAEINSQILERERIKNNLLKQLAQVESDINEILSKIPKTDVNKMTDEEVVRINL